MIQCECGWIAARKSLGIPRPLPLIRHRVREGRGEGKGRSNLGAKLSLRIHPFGSNNTFVKPVQIKISFNFTIVGLEFGHFSW